MAMLAEVNKETNRNLIYLSSAKASTKSGTYFTTTINKPIDRIKEIEIQGVCLPFTFYNISAGNMTIAYYNTNVPMNMTPSILFTTTAAMITSFNNATTQLSIVGNKFVLTSIGGSAITIDPTLPGAAILGFTTVQTGMTVTADISTINNLPFYFHGSNNSITINLSGGTVAPGGSLSATLTPGYYTQTTYASSLAAAILATVTLSNVTVIAATVTYNGQTFGFDINITFSKTFTTATVDLTSELYSVFTVTNGPAAATLALSTPPPPALIPKTLYIRSLVISAVLNSPPQYSIIHKIVIPSSNTKQSKYAGVDIVPYQTIINGVPGKIIIDEAEYQVPLIAAKKQTLTTLDFQLLDESFSPINLNGLDWSIAIIITIN